MGKEGKAVKEQKYGWDYDPRVRRTGTSGIPDGWETEL